MRGQVGRWADVGVGVGVGAALGIKRVGGSVGGRVGGWLWLALSISGIIANWR